MSRLKYLLLIFVGSVTLLLLLTDHFFKVNAENTENIMTNGKQTDVYAEKYKLDDDPANLFYFLHISDLHISKFKDPTRISDFRKFCGETLDIFKPQVVIASGDLTDAKDKLLGSEQYVEEWQAYHKALLDHNVFNKTHWLDLRGNHDDFNVPQLFGPKDLFRNYSSQGRFHKRSYIYQFTKDDVKYDFIGLDASLEPGTKRPYNFIGMVTKEELDHVKSLVKNSDGNISIWFAHYPTSTILTPFGQPNIRKFVGEFSSSALFVAGHLHTLGRMVNRMYSLQLEGFLELELADFLRTRKYRLAAFDHGHLSVIDTPLDNLPIALVTNPKNMLFNNPFREDVNLIKESTHVRVLAFSKSPIKVCKIKIDDEQWKQCLQKTNNFFVVPWNPQEYSQGKHLIRVYIEDADGRTFENEHFFATDGTKISFDFLAKFVLMNDLTTLFQIGYAVALLVCTLPLVVFKVWQMLLKYGKVKRPQIRSVYWRRFAQRYIILCSINRIYFGLVVMIIWTTVGPWSCHEILDGTTGYIFLWGTFVDGHFVPGTLSYWYGIHQLAWFNFPLMIILAGVIKRSYNTFVTGGKTEERFLKVLWTHLPFFALILAELLLAIFYYIQNGTVAFLVCPLRTWSMIYTLYLFYQAHYRVPDSCFRSSVRIFTEDEPKQS